MVQERQFVFLLLLTFLFRLSTADTEVTCVLDQTCILPCTFQYTSDLVLHWIDVSGNRNVHSYYRDKDQLEHQHQHFKGRTSLSKELSRGNASLELTRVRAEDKGRYKCYTSTIDGNQESFVNLKIEDNSESAATQLPHTRITVPPSDGKSTPSARFTEENLPRNRFALVVCFLLVLAFVVMLCCKRGKRSSKISV
ncbi:myelin-oligodendrocyte glycoprotein-like [Cyprinodon tularosa]|uniref:myelin-oligodendrocyte glycoprotein-like n=1 Tax=Cyprinodon tularosa TaxID=77115 RepID=UPI0018E26D41|nr:myelin-oligodendrocyte glycoprotein-like [Cyprinodon tularosa]